MLLAFAYVAALALTPEFGQRCSVEELRESPGYRYRVERIGEFVDSAAVVVRAIAVAGDTLPAIRAGLPGPSIVTFTIEERLRGADALDSLRVPGFVVAEDDYNPDPVPYTMVRSSGRRGSCFSVEYRVGAEYLLLLKNTPNGLSPYWAALAPLNEQIHGPDDPWLEWVRRRLRGSGG